MGDLFIFSTGNRRGENVQTNREELNQKERKLLSVKNSTIFPSCQFFHVTCSLWHVIVHFSLRLCWFLTVSCFKHFRCKVNCDLFYFNAILDRLVITNLFITNFPLLVVRELIITAFLLAKARKRNPPLLSDK